MGSALSEQTARSSTPSRLPADAIRGDATQWLSVSAIVQMLEARGIVLPETDDDADGERLLAEQFLQQASTAGQIGEVDPGREPMSIWSSWLG